MTLFEFQKAIVKQNSPFLGKDEQLKELHSISNNEQRELLISLLNRFYHITFEDIRKHRSAFIKEIFDNDNLANLPLLFGTLVLDDKPDSGQGVVYDMKIEFIKKLRKINRENEELTLEYFFKNRFGKVESVLQSNPDTKYNVILADEFIGSGKTLMNRMDILNNYNNVNEVHVLFYAGMEFAIQSILDKYPNTNIYVYKTLKKGISEFYNSEEDILDNKDLMTKLESTLKQEINGTPFSDYSLGYNQAESLYSNMLVDGNIPNNVFPIFWWPEDKDDNTRNSLFIRVDDKIW